MRQTLLILTTLFLTASLAQAQSIGYGGRLGLNLATQSNLDDDDSALNPGLQVAGFANFSVLDILAIQPELAFTQKGSRSTDGDTDIRANLNYLQLNALGQFRFGPGVKFLVNVGPYVGYAATGNLVFSIDDERESESIDDWEGSNRTDVGAILGAGAEIPLGFARLVVDARFSLGFNSFVEDAEDPVANRVLSLGAGLMFGR
ncbi:MAG: porin family protein [Bacteroidota bacterium]